ncbi:glycosyltransferase [Paraclostridium dentum]|uniref:glycosyltransferase n=1 Tax=Paraclostridium dentum TaxID=2662455 RepID=UPI003B00E7D9
MNILYLTSFVPKRNASQAGVNVTFDIIETVKNNYPTSKIDVIGLINKDEFSCFEKISLEYIDEQYFIPITKFNKIKNIILNIEKPLICGVRFDKELITLLKNLISKKKYDYVLVDYTQNIAYIDIIKNITPGLKVCVFEHDVSFLSFERKYKNSKNIIKRMILKAEYNRLLVYEKKMLKKYNYIYTLNHKDRNLLSEFENVDVLVPYFNKFKTTKHPHKSFNIMFWGAMNRKENEDAVLFFINDIWPYINKTNYDIKFFIVGSNPTDRIKNLASEDIIVTGFVEDPTVYFNYVDLSVIPLRYGAGIKIKVLESLAAGIPVITTDIGAEGINLENKINAYINNNAKEFIDSINYMLANEAELTKLSKEGLRLIEKDYDYGTKINSLNKFLNS